MFRDSYEIIDEIIEQYASRPKEVECFWQVGIGQYNEMRKWKDYNDRYLWTLDPSSRSTAPNTIGSISEGRYLLGLPIQIVYGDQINLVQVFEESVDDLLSKLENATSKREG